MICYYIFLSVNAPINITKFYQNKANIFMATSYIQQSTDVSKQSRLYSSRLKQLRDSIVMSKGKTKTEAKSQLPTLSYRTQSSTKKQQKLLSYSNRHLRYLFHQFCKQSYIGGAHATFDQIAESAQVMTLNKWMVFCRQFQLTSKLKNKEMVDIFKKATDEKTHMNIFDFCKAIEIAQTKSNIDEDLFATEILRVDSHAAARKRLCVMKISFNGPKQNFFELSQLTEKQRQQEKKANTQRKAKQRQYVLHQGMFKEHIEYQLQQRKIQRSQRSKIRNKSAIYNQSQNQFAEERKLSKQKQRVKAEPLIKVNRNYKTKTKSVFQNYSKIYQTKKNIKNPQNENISNLSIKNALKIKYNEQQQHQSKSRLKFEQKKYNNNSENQILREATTKQIQQIQQKYEEMERVREKWKIDDSDAQSDQILKSHYQSERKINKNRSNMHDDKFNEKQDAIKQKEDEDELQTDLMITRYN